MAKYIPGLKGLALLLVLRLAKYLVRAVLRQLQRSSPQEKAEALKDLPQQVADAVSKEIKNQDAS